MVSGPAVEPLSLAEAKKQVEVADAIADHDAHLASLVRAARETSETYCKRAWHTQTWRLALDRFPDWTILVPRPPLISVSSITYIDDDGVQQTLAAGLYRVAVKGRPGRITPAYNEVWPVTRAVSEAVVITYVAGYGANPGDEPSRVKQAVALTVGNWFANREGVVTGTISSELPQSAKWLLDSLRVGVAPGEYRLLECEQ